MADQGVDEKRNASLLARMAGNIACGVEANPSYHNMSPNDVAKRAVEVARCILSMVAIGETH